MKVTDEDVVAVVLLCDLYYPGKHFRSGDVLYGHVYAQFGRKALRISNKMHGLSGFTSVNEFSGGKDGYRRWRQISPLEALASQAE